MGEREEGGEGGRERREEGREERECGKKQKEEGREEGRRNNDKQIQTLTPARFDATGSSVDSLS